MTVVAIFDLDNTIVRGSSLFHFGVYLARARLINPVQVIRHVGIECAYAHNGGEREGMPSKIAGRVLRLVAGRSQALIRSHAEEFARHHLRESLLPSTLAEIMAFQFRGIPVHIASASPQELVEAIAGELGVAGAIGTIAEVRQGRYTGELASPIAHGMEKALRAQELLKSLGVHPHACWAFSDSINDLPLLASVGHPVAVNPDRTLRRLAEVNDWPVLPGSGGRHRPASHRNLVALR